MELLSSILLSFDHVKKLLWSIKTHGSCNLEWLYDFLCSCDLLACEAIRKKDALEYIGRRERSQTFLVPPSDWLKVTNCRDV